MVSSLQKEFNLKEDFETYKKHMSYLHGDAPIQVLCLPKVIQSILLRNDLIRVYDLTFERLESVKGLGKKRVDLIVTATRRFLSGID